MLPVGSESADPVTSKHGCMSRKTNVRVFFINKSARL